MSNIAETKTSETGTRNVLIIANRYGLEIESVPEGRLLAKCGPCGIGCRADFKSDLHKSRKARPLYFTPEGLLEKKHDRLKSDASKWTPRRFWFACPWDLIKPEEVPDYAGLIWFKRRPKGYERHGLVETEVKPAPFRHGHRVSPNVEAHLRGVCYYRYLDLLAKITKP